MSQSYSKAISWIDNARIPFVEGDKFDIRRYNVYHDTFSSYEDRGSAEGEYIVNNPDSRGRFPANLLVSDDMLNDGSISKSSKLNNGLPKISGNVYRNDGATETIKDRGFDDKGTNSRYYDIDKWFDKLLEDIE
jgi:hypothetical protein